MNIFALGLIGFFAVALIYFAPWIVAYYRNHNNTLAIAMLNLFLGWTFIGWVVALVWGCTNNVSPDEDESEQAGLSTN